MTCTFLATVQALRHVFAWNLPYFLVDRLAPSYAAQAGSSSPALQNHSVSFWFGCCLEPQIIPSLAYFPSLAGRISLFGSFAVHLVWAYFG